ncbi:hypothetical protein AURDEDRAFT_162625 [Auricularia subglabra TFB-10046 SS5]|nr:hypothetical protein AURDEDRAFT_162625 [Auricularia subglabra TFB-10046 SS5]
MPLEECHRLTVYNTVYGVLKAIGPPSDLSQLEDVVRAALAAAREACANYSEEWNRHVSNSITQRLPPEVLAECLRAGDFTTRIRASHVSRAWRATALGDRSLWTSFSRSSFRDLDDQKAGFHQLETMLSRSDPLPFRVQLPHMYDGDFDDYEAPLPGILRRGIHRITEYSGPCWAFSEATYGVDAIFPKLLSFSCLDSMWEHNDYEVELYWNPREMPNLRHLAGPILSFHDLSSPLSTLTSLCFHLSLKWVEEQSNLFPSCPSLISLDLRSVSESTVLPPGPLPTSLRDVTLRSENDMPLDFQLPLTSWLNYRIPSLKIHCAGSISGPVAAFLALDDKPVALSLDSYGHGKITLVCEELCWAIETPGYWSWLDGEYIDEMRVLIAKRATSITISFVYLVHLFYASIAAPRLLSLGVLFSGTGEEENVDLRAPSTRHRLQAPNLRHVVVSIPGTRKEIEERADSHEHALSSLIENFPKCVAFGTDKLDTVTLRCAAPDIVNHLGLAQLSKEYIEVQ